MKTKKKTDERTHKHTSTQTDTHIPFVILPVWLSCEVLRLLRDMPTTAAIFAPMLERLFLRSPPTRPTAVSDWLPSVFSRLHMSPPMLVLLVRLAPLVMPICLFFILDAKSLSVGRRSHQKRRKERDGEKSGKKGKREKNEQGVQGESGLAGRLKFWME